MLTRRTHTPVAGLLPICWRRLGTGFLILVGLLSGRVLAALTLGRQWVHGRIGWTAWQVVDQSKLTRGRFLLLKLLLDERPHDLLLVNIERLFSFDDLPLTFLELQEHSAQLKVQVVGLLQLLLVQLAYLGRMPQLLMSLLDQLVVRRRVVVELGGVLVILRRSHIAQLLITFGKEALHVLLSYLELLDYFQMFDDLIEGGPIARFDVETLLQEKFDTCGRTLRYLQP